MTGRRGENEAVFNSFCTVLHATLRIPGQSERAKGLNAVEHIRHLRGKVTIWLTCVQRALKSSLAHDPPCEGIAEWKKVRARTSNSIELVASFSVDFRW
jgi:hypothetical protein